MSLEDRLKKVEEALGELRRDRLRRRLDTLDAAAFLIAQFARYLEAEGGLDTTGMRAHVIRDLDRHDNGRISRANAARMLLRQLDAAGATNVRRGLRSDDSSRSA